MPLPKVGRKAPITLLVVLLLLVNSPPTVPTPLLPPSSLRSRGRMMSAQIRGSALAGVLPCLPRATVHPHVGHGRPSVFGGPGGPLGYHPAKSTSHFRVNPLNIVVASHNLGFGISEPESMEALELSWLRRGIDIIALQEVWRDRRLKASFNGSHYAFIVGPKDKQGRACAFAAKLSLITARGRPEHLSPSPRIMTLRWRTLGIALVNGYAPTLSGGDEQEREAFWSTLDNTTSQVVSEYRRTFLCGDFNAHLEIPGQPPAISLDPNAMRLGEVMRYADMSVCNWKGGTRPPHCHTFKGNSAIPSSTVDYIAIGTPLLHHIRSFSLVSHLPSYPKISSHKLALVHAQFPAKRQRQDRPQPVCRGPLFSEKATASTVDLAYGNLLRAFAQYEAKSALVIPTLNVNYVSDYSTQLAALIQEVKEAGHRDPEAVTSDHLRRLEERYKKSRDKDKEDALELFTREIDELFSSPEQHLVYKALRKALRSSGAIGHHTSQHTKVVLFEHFRELLGSATTNPDLVLDPCERPLKPSVREHVPDVPPKRLFTDGSFFEDLGLCGWSVVDAEHQVNRCGNVPHHDTFPFRDFKITAKEFHCGFAETYAILEALRAFPHLSVVIYTDAESCIKVFDTLESLEVADFREVSYGHLWKEIRALSRWRKVRVEKVPAHAGVEYNEEADVLAKFGAFLPNGAARILRCPTDPWWKALLRTASHLGPDDSARGRVYASNLILQSFPYFPSLTLIPRRFTPPLPPLEPRDDPPDRHEIITAIGSLSEVAEGADQIPAEIVKDPTFTDAIESLITLIWRTCDVPVDWQRTIMLGLRKDSRKPLGKDNCRGISLTSIPSRVLTSIIKTRAAAADILAQQFGFRRAHNCPQAQLIVRQLLHSSKANGRPLVLAFIDFRKAFDSIDRSKLRQVLGLYGLGNTTITLVERLWEDEVVVRFPDGTYSDPLLTRVGTKQGCVFSPLAFNLYINLGLSRALSGMTGVPALDTWGNEDTLKALLYADDLVLFATSSEEMSRNLEVLTAAMSPLGLKINHTKTHVMFNSVYGYCSQDTTTGYFSRMDKKQQVKGRHPLYSRTRITHSQGEQPCLHTSPRAPCLGCPYSSCPYVTKHDAALAPGQLRDHMSGRHHISVTLRPLPEALLEETSDDPVLRNTVPVSKAPRGLEGAAPRPPVTVQGHHIAPVLHFEYLGSFISSDGSLRKEAVARSINANWAFKKLPEGLWKSDLPLWIKWELYKHLILPILVYGTEAWAPTEEDVAVLESTLIRHIRAMTGMGWHSKVVYGVHTRVLPPRSSISAVADFPSMSDILRTSRLRLYGQIARAGPYSFIGKWVHSTVWVECSAPRGPKACGWSQMISDDLLALNLNASHTFALADWRERIKYQPRGPKRPETSDWL